MEIGYKATNNMKCKTLTYEVGKTYTFEGELKICQQGFHFCKDPNDVFKYYDYNKDFVLLEIEILGTVIDDRDKSVTNKFKVLRVIPKEEYNNIFTKSKFDENNNLKYYENSNGLWEKHEYDENGNRTHSENSVGEEYFVKIS